MKLSQKLAALATTAMLLTNVLSSVARATVASGTLSVGSFGAQSLPGDITLTGQVSTSYQEPGLTGTLTNITITDTRGSAAGWTAASSVDQNFHLAASSVKKYITGSGTITGLSGEYEGGEYEGVQCQSSWTATGTVPCGSMIFKITAVSGGTPTTYSYWATSATFPGAPSGTDGTVTDGVFSGAAGLSGTFAGTWAVDDYVRFSVDYFPATSYFYGQASDLTANSGYSTFGMTVPTSSPTAYTVSTARTDISAPAGTGAGIYTYDLDLALAIHGNALSGSYNSAMTFSLTSL